MLTDTLRAIAELQPSYSSENTPPMQERGRLIRHELVAHIRGLQPELAAAMAEFGADFIVGASDGIGRKTEAPWVRFASREMSPNPTDGFYVVIHFSADGSAVWVTVGCGSTIWTGGDLRPLPTQELKRRTDWARAIVEGRFGSIAPFTDEIALGAKAALPQTFERATALAQRFDPAALDDSSFEASLRRAAEFLAEIYRSQRTGAHLTPAQVGEMQLEELSRPSRQLLKGQGIGLTAAERRAVELRAMALARAWLEAEGYKVVDRSAKASFDFEATKGGEVMKVEVKGTTSPAFDAFFMTRNEVLLHQEQAGATALVMVSGIRLESVGGEVKATGGKCEVSLPWDISEWVLDAMAYRVTRGVN